MTEQNPTSIRPLDKFKNNLALAFDRNEFALPDNVRPEAFRNAAIVAFQDSTYLQSCTPESVFKALRTLAAAGLVPDGREAAIVPFKGTAQAMPMVYGLIKVARNSGKVKSLWAEVVYEGEKLDIGIEDGKRTFKHVNEDGSPIDAMSRGGEIRGAFAVAKLDDGSVDFQAMSRDEIEKRRMASANQKDANRPTDIWGKWYDEMAKKTVIRNLCKRLPMSSEDITRLMVEQEAPEIKDVTPPPAERKTLAQQLTEAEDVPSKDINADVSDALEFIEADVFPGDDEYDAGVKAYEAGEEPLANPHTANPAYSNWIAGYEHAANLAEEA